MSSTSSVGGSELSRYSLNTSNLKCKNAYIFLPTLIFYFSHYITFIFHAILICFPPTLPNIDTVS